MAFVSLVKQGILAIAATTLMSAGTSNPAQALTLFSDDFDGENGGIANNSTLNYNQFTNWQVVAGSGGVDLIGEGFINLHPNNGLYVDLDGTGNNAGLLRSKRAFDFAPGFSYTLGFDLGGSKRGSDEVVRVRLGLGDNSLLDREYTIPSVAELTTYTESFSVSSPTRAFLFFANGPFLGNTLFSRGDNVGAILDNVNLSATALSANPLEIPVPTLLPGLLGLGLGVLRKHKKTT
ncbi:MAG: PTPA-CTERM sorting domain-containing protein [Leptolyngbyaceae cyanobacterium SL_7_1]|nr:PTPA-CTERM sorting domain-containing protein [Leptolyngbyaceae cyanobacterium SL_7_1]